MSTVRAKKVWLAALMLPLLAACETAEAGDASSAQSAEVIRGNLIATAEATGILEPVRKVEVTSKASGEILRLYVDTGDVIEPGDLLAEVDPRDVRNAADQANADIAVARARIAIAEAQVERSNELLRLGVVSPQEHESSTLEFANAQAGLVKAETNSELAQLRLQDVTIRAPSSGTVLEKNVEEGQVIQSSGQNVSSGTTLFVMADLNVVQVRTFVNEGDLGEIKEGMRTSVSVDAYPNRTFVGMVDQIEPQAVVQSGATLFPLIVQLDNSSGLLKPGMNTAVEIQTGEATGVLLIPNSSVVMIQDAEPAALALGLDAEAVDMGSLMGGMRGMFAGGRPGGDAEARPEGGRPEGARAEGARSADGNATAQGGSARAQRPGRDGSQNAARRQGGQRGGPDMGGMGRFARGGADGADQVEPAVVFLIAEDGTIEPRMVMIGLTDWDNTAVVSGLEEGDRVALIGLAQLQAQREAYLERMRSRGGNPFGGMRGGMRGGMPH
ncbi:MAG TPA: efflux RND transporter periplasmic adaptor subunit [Gemmatimonadetes bacterium]|nr:efflux RND transporter periplasmic adaptor subunit [Gemmatimonadota bacterium]